MKLRAILVDDEPLALDRLERQLGRHADCLELVGRAENGADAVQAINELAPDVVFLDVQMPVFSGFEVLERLDYTPLVIFTTAYDQYALKAFDVYSIDYLLKPIDPSRLRLAIEKLRRHSAPVEEDLRDRVRQALETMRSPLKERIQVKVGDRIRLITVADVVYFLASEKYVEVHTLEGSHLITQSLSRLESELPGDAFVRVHRSVILNLDFLDEIARTIGGAYEARMKDKKRTRLPVSRRYKSRLWLS